MGEGPQAAEEGSRILKLLPQGIPADPLTATILFMASSLRESLLVSSIAFRSSCLVRTRKLS